MKRKTYLFAGSLFVLALLLVASGITRVVSLYESYRSDMLTYESRHLNSIVSTSARGMTWMISGYLAQIDSLVERIDFEQAEAQYFDTGNTESLQRFVRRPDILQIGMQCKFAIYDQNGALLASTDESFPQSTEADEPLGDNGVLRQGENGTFWFVFLSESEQGLRCELAVSVQSMFSSHASSASIGRHGYLFLMDRGGRFFACSTGGETMTYSMEAAQALFPDMDEDALEELASSTVSTPESYRIYQYPWENLDEQTQATSETLVLTYPVAVGTSSLVMGAAVSFQEFSSILTDTLDSVITVIILEIAGAALLILMIAWMLIRSRRSALQMAVLKEKADIMEEINRQQQSLAHSERLQQLGVMTSGMAHEFNNLMTPIMSQSLLLLEQLADQEETPQFDSALDIYEASEKARSIIKGMSAMSKKDGDLSFRTLDLAALLRKTMELGAMAKDPHVQQELVTVSEPVFISGNEQLLAQVFLNLFINGYQAMGGEGKLTVSMETEHRSGIDYVRVDVMDTGPGIPESNIGQIYDPFFTTKGKHGTGLGLMICRKTVETHKGTIYASNRPEGGAVFSVRLPVCELSEEE